MRLFGILLLVLIIPAGGAYVYFATQDWKGRQQINAAGLRHLLLLQGLPVEGEDFNAEDETPFQTPMAGGESTKTVSKKLLENYFKDNTAVGAAPAVGTPGVEPPPVARLALATTDPVTSQYAELKRVFGLLKVELAKATTPDQKTSLVESWLLIQAETMTERIWYQTLISPTKKIITERDKVTGQNEEKIVAKDAAELADSADELVYLLNLKFYRVAPKLFEEDKLALASAKWDALQKKIEEAGGDANAVARLKPPVFTDDGDRRARLAHLLVHLDRDGAWQKRVAVIVGLRQYVQAIAAQTARFREMRNHVDLPNATDQATFQKNQDALITKARQEADRARAIAGERGKLEKQQTAAETALSLRESQLVDLKAQLQKVKDEVDQLLVRQSTAEKKLFEAQRLVSLTLEDVYRLEALLIEVERERYGLSPTRP